MANGHGGARVGAGRKPGGGSSRPKVVLHHEFRSVPDAPTTAPEDPDGLGVAPSDAPEAEQKVWVALAPYALIERTLTASRAPGFRVLCQRWVYCAEIDARIRVLGITSGEADRLLKRLEAWQKLLGASLGEFNLRSFGKPVTAEKPKGGTVNPFAALMAR